MYEHGHSTMYSIVTANWAGRERDVAKRRALIFLSLDATYIS